MENMAATGLHLVGTGAGSPLNMTVGGKDIASMCDYRFLEGYTSLLGENGEGELEKLVGAYEIVRRPEVENPERILELAKSNSVALLVIGDPMQATTHVDLLLRCKDEGIHTSIHHAVSAIDLVCAGLGLQSYRFGRQVSLTFPHANHLPTSPMEFIAENRFLGLHTLVLLDLDPTGMGIEQPQPMTPPQAFEVMCRMIERLRDDPPPHLELENISSARDLSRLKAVKSMLNEKIEDFHAVICSNLGSPSAQVNSGLLGEIAGSCVSGIHSIVITGELIGMEKSALERLH
ncbi:diphthine synthase [Deltaproteobacteria bacterium]|nr:diphthine synthase [Deltaproteobacteria bacterium]